jgi:PAS domain S-box-containing protein
VISVLYVDDEPALLDLTKRFLEKKGTISVDVADSGNKALGMLETGQYDVIVSDYQMPGMDGIALLKEIRKRNNTIPFIIFTGRGREEVVIEAFENGADFYIQKGGDPRPQFAELERKISKAVELYKAEHEHLESEERLRQIIQFLPDATFAIDTEGKVIAWNRAMERMTGVPASEILGKGNFEYALPFYHERRPILIDLVLGDYPEIEAKYPYLKRVGKKLYAEITIPHLKQGKGAALWFTASPLYDTQGRIVGAIESIRDITDRKKAEEALLEVQREYTSLLDQIQDVYYRTDADGRLVKASRSWAALLGYDDISECIGRPIAEDFYYNPADRKKFLQELNRNGRVTNYEVLFRKKDGSPVLVSTSSHLYYAPDGTILGVEGTFRDITRQKQIEDALRASEERYRRIFSTMPSAVIVYEAVDNGEDFIIRDFNPRAEEIERISKNDVIGRRVTEVFPGVREFGLLSVFQQVWKTGEVAYFPPALYRDDRDPGTWRENWVYRLTSGEIVAIYNDVTSWVRAQEDLRKTEERYRNIIEDQTEFVCRFLPDGTHVFVNRAYAACFGKTPEELIGHVFKPAIHPHDREMVRDFFASLTPDHPVGTIEHRIIMPDGEIRWHQWSDRAIFDENGRLTEYQSVGRDITDLKRVEETLREGEERYRRLAENAEDLVYRFEFFPTRRFTYVSPSATKITGYSPEEHYADPDLGFKIVLEEDRPLLESLTRGDINAMKKPLVLRWRRKDGSVIWTEQVNVPVFDEQGTMVAIEGIARDITERKCAEEQSRVIAQIMDIAPVSITIHDREGNFLYANQKTFDIHGFSRDEFMKLRLHELDTPESAALIESRMQEILEKGEGSLSVTHRMKGGGSVPLFVTVKFASWLGKPAIISVATDLSERLKAEDALRTANRKLNLLSSLTRHDINNQLTIIQGYVTLLAEGQTDPGMVEKIGIIQRATDRIAAMIRFTKEYENVGVENPAWQDVRHLVDSAAAEVQFGSIQVINDIPEGTEVFADPLIRRVLFNLVENSVRYGERVTAIRFSAEEKGGSLSIVCEDDGVGVLPGEKEKIFERGYGKNTGMGLFLSREILGITGITITENGEPGKGARFEITVPPGKFRRRSTKP